MTKASRPRMVFPVVLFPDPVFPSRTILRSLITGELESVDKKTLKQLEIILHSGQLT